jgi:hypothetical protein
MASIYFDKYNTNLKFNRMKKRNLTSLQLQKKSIASLDVIAGGQEPIQNNYTRANCERSQPLSICHCQQ